MRNIINLLQNIITRKKVKKCIDVITYIVFALMSLLYVRIIIALCGSIIAVRDGGFVKLIDKNSQSWYYRSEDNVILHDEILLGSFLIVLILCLFLIKRPKTAIFIQIVWLLIVIMESFLINAS